ncbi:hypothetical protein AgCh_004641 [Apium graveolens]
MSTVRTLLELAASKQWDLHQLDMNNAFLHDNLKEEASQEWHEKLVEELLCQDFTQSRNDYSLFVKKQLGLICVVVVYVDDVILTGDDVQSIAHLKSHLDALFGIKVLGRLHYFLGIEVSHSPDGIALCQRKFATELLSEAAIDLIHPVCTPLPVHLKLSNTEGVLLSNPEVYRSLVGKLNYLTNTRPDLSYTVQTLSQYMHPPRNTHLSALHNTLRYLDGTIHQGILLKASDQLKLQAFSDVDWGSCLVSRRSITDYILLLGDSPVSWKSKKQHTVSKSSAEAEYRAMASAATKVTWLVRLLDELGLLQLSYLPTKSQLADVLTKVSSSLQFNDLLTKLGMLTLPNLRGDIEHKKAEPSSTSALPHSVQLDFSNLGNANSISKQGALSSSNWHGSWQENQAVSIAYDFVRVYPSVWSIDVGRSFFALPKEEKLKVRRDESNPFGYYDSELTKNVIDTKEVFGFTVENPTILPAYAEPDDKEFINLLNYWPAKSQLFQPRLMNWYDNLLSNKTFGVTIFRASKTIKMN